MTNIANFHFAVEPHSTANCPYTQIRDINPGDTPPELVVTFVAGFRLVPVAVPQFADLFELGLVKRLARLQHGIRLRFHFEEMLSAHRDRVGFFRLMIANALCDQAERIRIAAELQNADDAVPMVPVCEGCSHA